MATEGGQPSREEFFTQLEDQLKANEGIDDTTLPIIMEVLKGAIKTVPVPKPVTPTTTGLTEDQVKKLFEKLYAAKKKKDDEEEEEEEGKMAKPTRASYLRWLRKELKGAGFDRDAIAKVMAIVKAAVKTPYPYPSPQKVKGEAAEVWEEDVKELEDEVGNLEKTITEKEGEITTMKTELDTLRAAETKRKEDAITGLVNTIKEVDEGFDAEKYLENVEDLDSKMTLLNKYHETIQRLKPAISLGGVDATPEGEARINKVLMETFGTTELFPKEGED